MDYCSSKTIALSIPSGWSRGWFTGVSYLQESVGIQMGPVLPEAGVKRERFRKRERRKRHFPKILGSEASGKRLLYIHIIFYIYCIYIQKNM
jgi:hypothetical protein